MESETISDPKGWKRNMPNEREGNDKPDQDLPGDGHKMSSALSTSTSTSSPTPEVSESPSENGASSGTTPTDREGNLASLLSFPRPSTGSFSTSPSPDPDKEREFTLTLHLSTFGKERQLHQSVAGMLHDLTVTGHHIIAAYVNEEEVTERYKDEKDRRWDDPQFKGFFSL